MSVTSYLSADGKELTLNISGRFDYAIQEEFSRHYLKLKPHEAVKVRLDMRDAEYMDSSGLGLLLIMREYVGGNASDITIVNCSDSIRNILRVANFQNLFTLA